MPVYFLDADLPSNSEFDRNLTGSLYGGDSYYRLCQEVVLGIGGVRMLRALGYNDLTRFHMNEGHAGLLSLELLGEEAQKAGRTSIRGEDIEKVRGKCVFTTHTPVPAGHDRFPVEYLTRVFPGQLNFFDLSDATAADLVKRILQAEQNVSGLLDAARQGASGACFRTNWILHFLPAPRQLEAPRSDVAFLPVGDGPAPRRLVILRPSSRRGRCANSTTTRQKWP